MNSRLGWKVLAIVAFTNVVSAFPNNNPDNSQTQGRYDLGAQQPIEIVPVVVLTENAPANHIIREGRQYGRPPPGGRRPSRPVQGSHSHPGPPQTQTSQGDYFGGGGPQGSYSLGGGQQSPSFGGEYFGGPQGAPQESHYQVTAGGPPEQFDQGGFESAGSFPPSGSQSAGYYPQGGQSSGGQYGGSNSYGGPPNFSFGGGPSSSPTHSHSGSGGSPFSRQR